MRHKHKGNRLSRKSSHRLSLLQNLSSDLILHESVETTLAKAKELKRYAEKMITKANTVKGYEKSVYENLKNILYTEQKISIVLAKGLILGNQL